MMSSVGLPNSLPEVDSWEEILRVSSTGQEAATCIVLVLTRRGRHCIAF